MIHRDLRDLSSWEREEGKGEAGVEGKQGEVAVPPSLRSVPALSSTFRAVGCQATMPTLLEWPSSTTTGSVRDRVSPFSGICHTCKGKESCSAKGGPSEGRVARLLRASRSRRSRHCSVQTGRESGRESFPAANKPLADPCGISFLTHVPAQTHSS